MGVHDGHRERLKEQFAEYGLETFNDVNALELLLFYAIPRCDTNEIAHALLNRFENLSGVFSASVEDLTEVNGVGKNTALFLTLIPEIIKKSRISKTKEMKQIHSCSEAGAYFVPRFINCSKEIFLMVCLDTKRNIICCKKLGVGSPNNVDINMRLVVETALKMKAASVIIAHNHPSGTLVPSREDESITVEISNILNAIDVKLDDHIIVGKEKYVSLANSNYNRIFR